MARKPKKIELGAEERATLKMWDASGKTEQRLARRAQVVLLASEGKGVKAIGSIVGLSWQRCMKWRKRFAEHRIEGLKDLPRSGKPQQITPEERVEVMALACTEPDDGSTRWSVRRLADACGFSKSTVHRIFSEASLKPHKVDHWCGKSPDPEFSEKQAAILGLCLSPPENALVLSVDEKSQIQVLNRTQPLPPMRSGNPKRHTRSYTRHGTACLLAALLVHEGTVEGRCVERHTHEEFLSFLKHLYRKYPCRQLHVIEDNYSDHKHEKFKERTKQRTRLTLHFTPTYTSWLNQTETWFGILTRHVIRDGVPQSKQELVQSIMLYIRRYNEERAVPFKWTYTGKPCVA